MKKRSSLKTKRCELVPPVVSNIITPVHRPCNQHTETQIRFNLAYMSYTHIFTQTYLKTHYCKGCNGLIHPSIFLQQMTDHDTSAKKRDK